MKINKNKLIGYTIVAVIFLILILLSIFTNIFNYNRHHAKKVVVPLHETIGAKKVVTDSIPPMVEKGLIFEFSDAEVIDWQVFNNYFIDFDDTIMNIYQDEEPSVYIANFIKQNHFYRAQFHKNGALIFSEMFLKFDELPSQVQRAFRNKFKKKDIKDEIRMVKEGEKNTYRIKINKESKNFILVYNPDGYLVHEKIKLSVN